ncbi:MAG: hypothetical protein D3910_07590, partial [Candidatus Electrothrix sp. ATG2]|nr:hypothetical protein [Candidatus Electrothrix sp. ATG2]
GKFNGQEAVCISICDSVDQLLTADDCRQDNFMVVFSAEMTRFILSFTCLIPVPEHLSVSPKRNRKSMQRYSLSSPLLEFIINLVGLSKRLSQKKMTIKYIF